MTNQELVVKILDACGGRENVISAANCMTRLRITVKDNAKINDEELKGIEGVLGIVHDRVDYVEVVVGPGKCRKCADICAEMGIPASAAMEKEDVSYGDWQANKKEVQAKRKDNPVRNALKIFGEIFIPLIPGVIAAGLCAGFNTLIQQLNPGWADQPVLSVICNILGLINTSFMTYLTAWAGYRAAERFGGTPILGGMLGLITGLDGINAISSAVGWFNNESPLDSILRSGRGGVLAAVLGVMIL
ncbi:MAG: PTS transporter subunit EIIB, partial [Solobacterium sp.]|nr:PTS transporter subunit EIIB [Solobacterium sp.]